MKKNLYILIIIFSLLWLFPIGNLIINFFDFENFLSTIMKSRTIRILKFTLIQSSLSVFFSFFIGIFPAFYVANNKNLLSKLLDDSFFIPFFFPPIPTIIAFSLLYGSNGIFYHLFKINILYTLTAIIMAHSFYNSPIFVKYISDSLKSIPKNFVENAIIDGANKSTIFNKIILPIILPAILKAAFLVFTYSFVSFAIVLSLGGIKYSTFEVAIFTTLRSSLDFSKALTYALIQFFVLLTLNYIISIPKIYELNVEENYTYKNNIFITVFSIFYLIYEYSIVLTGTLSGFFDFINKKFTIKGFSNLFSKDLNLYYPILKAFYNTFFISFIVSILVIFFTYIILRNIKTHKQMLFSNIFIISSLGISSAFLAMGLLSLNINFSISYPILLGIGYLIISVPLAYTFMQQRILSFDYSIIEASKIDGANTVKTFLFIELPILKNTLLSVFLQIFAIIFGEFTISYTMQSVDYFPLISNINYKLSNARYYLESQTLASITIVFIFIIFNISIFLNKEKQ
ncbi:thiamine transport system permease protein [Marinitoga hydrogenitolerans DSM 16785]|uniref:Thiamine transport system permease protein n=1 Tax=Marinitoga hydrogenitolerans (strain DSM 16785 / JCM 12826 / AT1271) TaxID=1122195 RepID=A0A1M4VFR8_MARH1|nr:ABC transporter permease subunit [Marinitoga hydrogenitolerans]SHE67874.1 thiamine transport system permease protein [Marinitoga hydrogenitolerans DSM 16785]